MVTISLKIYQPLVDYLSVAIGEKIVIDPVKNYQEYTKKMCQNKYDIILDGSHFINWRIENLNHVEIAKQFPPKNSVTWYDG